MVGRSDESCFSCNPREFSLGILWSGPKHRRGAAGRGSSPPSLHPLSPCSQLTSLMVPLGAIGSILPLSLLYPPFPSPCNSNLVGRGDAQKWKITPRMSRKRVLQSSTVALPFAPHLGKWIAPKLLPVTAQGSGSGGCKARNPLLKHLKTLGDIERSWWWSSVPGREPQHQAP